MKRKILINLLIITLNAFVIYVGIIILQNHKMSKGRVIDLPEEIQLAEFGDTLQVYAITQDTIYIGFKPRK